MLASIGQQIYTAANWDALKENERQDSIRQNQGEVFYDVGSDKVVMAFYYIRKSPQRPASQWDANVYRNNLLQHWRDARHVLELLAMGQRLAAERTLVAIKDILEHRQSSLRCGMHNAVWGFAVGGIAHECSRSFRCCEHLP